MFSNRPIWFTSILMMMLMLSSWQIAAKKGLLFNPTFPRVRLVTHRDVTFEDVEMAAKIILEELS